MADGFWTRCRNVGDLWMAWRCDAAYAACGFAFAAKRRHEAARSDHVIQYLAAKFAASRTGRTEITLQQVVRVADGFESAAEDVRQLAEDAMGSELLVKAAGAEGVLQIAAHAAQQHGDAAL